MLNTGKVIEPNDISNDYNELECALNKESNSSTSYNIEVESFKEYLNLLVNQTRNEKQVRVATALNVIKDCENVWNKSFKGARLNVGTYIFPNDVGSDYNEVSTALTAKVIKKKM